MKLANCVRRAAVLVMLVVVAGVFLACGSRGDPSSPAASPPPESDSDRGAGTIRLSLPAEIFGGGTGALAGSEVSATAVDTAAAQVDAEILEILVLEERPAGASGTDTELTVGDQPTVAESLSVSATDMATELAAGTPVPLDISVAPGNYRLLVLAGTESGSTSCLLASGYTATAVTVAENQISQVGINLSTITHDISVPGTILAGDPFTISASGDTNNPVLTAESSGTTDTYGFQAKFDTDSSLSVLNATFVDTAWTVTHGADAPASEQAQNWYTAWMFAGPYITYKDSNTSAWIVLDGDQSRQWRWLSYTVLGQTSQLWPEVAVPVALQPSTTGVMIELTWS